MTEHDDFKGMFGLLNEIDPSFHYIRFFPLDMIVN